MMRFIHMLLCFLSPRIISSRGLHKRLLPKTGMVWSGSFVTFTEVEPGHTILVHVAAGGVGSLLCQWANALGATVIGIVSNKEKAAQAKEDGCHHVIIYKEEDFVSRVKEITSGNGVEVVYIPLRDLWHA